MSIDGFEDWFRDNSRGMFGEGEKVIAACVAVEAAFSMIRFDNATEEEFQVELANAIRPFEATVRYLALPSILAANRPQSITLQTGHHEPSEMALGWQIGDYLVAGGQSGMAAS
jgi:hypothetical protein